MLPPPPPRPPHEVPRGDDNARSSMDFFRKKTPKTRDFTLAKPGKICQKFAEFIVVNAIGVEPRSFGSRFLRFFVEAAE